MTAYQRVLITAPYEAGCVEETLDDSAVPDGSILVCSRYSLISTGTELACLRGVEDWFSIPGTPGYCNAGEVVGVGKGVDGFSVGDQVYTDAGHVGRYFYAVDRHSSSLVFRVLPGVPMEFVPYMRLASIALTSTNVSDIQVGDRVLVVGLGVVGNFAAQFAQLQGAEVLCAEVSRDRVEVARQCGLRHFVDPNEEDFAEHLSSFTGGAGFDTVIEATGRTEVTSQLLPNVKRNGEWILLGTPRGEYLADLTGLLRAQHLADQNITIKGAHEVRYPTWDSPFVKHSRERNMRRIAKLLQDGRLSVAPMITEIAGPEAAGRVYRELLDHTGRKRSVLFAF